VRESRRRSADERQNFRQAANCPIGPTARLPLFTLQLSLSLSLQTRPDQFPRLRRFRIIAVALTLRPRSTHRCQHGAKRRRQDLPLPVQLSASIDRTMQPNTELRSKRYTHPISLYISQLQAKTMQRSRDSARRPPQNSTRNCSECAKSSSSPSACPWPSGSGCSDRNTQTN
jgi:hypothetical protein